MAMAGSEEVAKAMVAMADATAVVVVVEAIREAHQEDTAVEVAKVAVAAEAEAVEAVEAAPVAATAARGRNRMTHIYSVRSWRPGCSRTTQGKLRMYSHSGTRSSMPREAALEAGAAAGAAAAEAVAYSAVVRAVQAVQAEAEAVADLVGTAVRDRNRTRGTCIVGSWRLDCLRTKASMPRMYNHTGIPSSTRLEAS